MGITEEMRGIFNMARLKLGGGIRSVEIEDDAMCACMDMAMLKYNQFVQNFIIESNWSNFYGKSVSNTDLAFAFSVRTLDLSREIGDYFSHIVGLQQHGDKWELKKDFFKIECGKQSYVIPAGRQINKVLWFTMSTADAALVSTYYGGAYGFGNGVLGQIGGAAGAFGGVSGLYGIWAPFYAASVYDVALAGTHMADMNKFLGNDLTFKVTAGPDGTHIVHLANVPGGRFERMGGFGRLHQCYCWYTYYDSNGNDEECIRDNADDIVLSPDQIPMTVRGFELLNAPAKATVTRIFIGEVAETVGFVRGKFSGSVSFLSNPLTLDYNMLITYGQKERDDALTELKERLERMTPQKMLEREAEMTENAIRALKGTPLGLVMR